METKHIVIAGVVAVAAFMFWRSRQAATEQTFAPGPYPDTSGGGAPAPAMGGGMSYTGAVSNAVGGVTSGSFAQRAVGGVVSGVTGLAKYGVNKAVSTTVGSIKSSVGTTVGAVKTVASGVSSAAHGVVSSITSIF